MDTEFINRRNAPDPICSDGQECLRVRVHGPAAAPTLIYLPGIHGDWTLVGAFHRALGGRVRFVDMTYPRTTSWDLAAYAESIEQELMAQGITEGWLLGESFGSQVLWELVRRSKLQYQGLILAGGFVRYPVEGFLRSARFVCPRVSERWLTRLLSAYLSYAQIRHRNVPDALRGARQFVARRTRQDLLAAVHRLDLIESSDPRETATRTRLPIHHVYGLFDPIVPWPAVSRWLHRYCPSFRGSHRVWYSDHTILASAAQESAGQVLQWMA